ncbi:hypothetical protein M433DRAFT_75141 [Acidomyces richmondensis BFW]|nr:MAG: hypothetical protein FE78DRAFT_37016 [Acidomyces sp. 'richmondensis']KYG41794.1 hypothetical protein M433DRAFT_75141 [Acidomyces richmondensis BFW]
MSQELLDEITSINAIYSPSTLLSLPEDLIYSLTLPSLPSISFRLSFPPDYPDAPPSILGTQTVGNYVAKGEGAVLVDLIRGVLSDVYTPGAPCIFDLIQESGERLHKHGMDQSHAAVGEKPQAPEANGATSCSSSILPDQSVSDDTQQRLEDAGDTPPWTLSDVITEKKSVFVARAAPVSSINQAKQFLAHLLATEKKVAKATHNITAWRIRGVNGVQYQDCDDDGETAAGGRLLHLLELMGIWDAMVVVTRWYGGVQLGPDRFRIINQTAREAVIRGGLVPDFTGKDGSSTKRKLKTKK